MIIAIVNLKGGTGKTTTALGLAAAAAHAGMKVRVLDGDMQGTATDWADYAEEEGGMGFEVVPANIPMVRRLRDKGDGWVDIVDCPPSGAMTDEAKDRADFVVIPSGPGNADMAKTLMTAAACKSSGKDYAVLLCQVRKNTLAATAAAEELSVAGVDRLSVVVYQREAVRAMFGRPFGDDLYGYSEAYGEIMGRMCGNGE